MCRANRNIQRFVADPAFPVGLRISFVASSAMTEVNQETARAANQLSFGWTCAELRNRDAKPEASATPSAASVRQGEETGILNTSSQADFPESGSQDQLSKAVNRALTELEDAGKIHSVQSDSGELRFTCLPVTEGASARLPLPCGQESWKTLPISLAKPVLDFCHKITERLSRCNVPAEVEGDAIRQIEWKLRALLVPFSKADEDGAAGYQWPASRLTGDDMKRLRVLANLSGLPCNEVLRVALDILFSQTRSLMHQALTLHEESQTPLPQLLDAISCHRR